MNGLFKVMPQTRLLQNVVLFEPFRGRVSAVFKIIVLLYNPTVLECEVKS